ERSVENLEHRLRGSARAYHRMCGVRLETRARRFRAGANGRCLESSNNTRSTEMDRTRVRAIEFATRRHDLPEYRRRRDAAALGRPPRTLSNHVHRSFRASVEVAESRDCNRPCGARYAVRDAGVSRSRDWIAL